MIRGPAALAAIATLGLGGCHPSPGPTRHECPTGDVRILGQRDLDALAGCATVPRLEIRTAAALDLAPLAGLTQVDGELVIGPTLALGSVRLPALAAVGGAVQIAGNGDLAGVYLPALATVGALAIRDDVALVQLSVPALATVAGDLTIARAPSLELVDTSASPRVGGALTVTAAPRLATWIGAPVVAGVVQVDAPLLEAAPTATPP